MELFEIIAPIANFAIVVFILWKYGKQPVLDFLRTRSKNIETQMKEAEAQFADAKKLLSQAEADSSGARAQVKQYHSEAAASIERFREVALVAAKQEAERIRRESQLVVQSEIAKAHGALEREIAQRSVSMAGKYLQTHLGDKEKHKLVSDYVEIITNDTAG